MAPGHLSRTTLPALASVSAFTYATMRTRGRESATASPQMPSNSPMQRALNEAAASGITRS
eukprot:3460637-Pyramimonas_sp.AAC.1